MPAVVSRTDGSLKGTSEELGHKQVSLLDEVVYEQLAQFSGLHRSVPSLSPSRPRQGPLVPSWSRAGCRSTS